MIIEPTERETDDDVVDELKHRIEQLDETIEKCVARGISVRTDIKDLSGSYRHYITGITITEIYKTRHWSP